MTEVKKIKIVGFGNAICDVNYQVADHFLETNNISKSAMELVSPERQQELISMLSSQKPARTSGGSVANSIFAFSELCPGASAFVASVGADANGRSYRDDLKNGGVKPLCRELEEAPTGQCLVLVTPDAERTMLTALGASAMFSPDDIPADQIAKAEWMFLEGYLLSSNSGIEIFEKLIECKKQSGVKLALTLSAPFIASVFRSNIIKALGEIDLLIGNVAEVQTLVEIEEEGPAFEELRSISKGLIMTRSERGAIAILGGEVVEVSSPPIEAIDATGAGDMFAGAFFHYFLEQHPLAECLTKACFLASEVVKVVGPRIEVGEVTRLTANSC